MHDTITSVMDSETNPLRDLPKAQRFQLMVILSIMWTTVFCLGIGNWLWYGELVTAHVAAAVGALVTGLTFRGARGSELAATHRDLYRSRDGGVRYDDIWGG